jgi:carbamoyl-phosphate synthase large subunit
MPPKTPTTAPSPACVLVPGAGGAAGIGAIKALRMAGYRGRIVSTDMDPLSPGLKLADVGHVLPAAAHADFFPRALELIRRERVEVILPTSGFDTPAYSHHLDELRAAGVVVVGCSAEVMETCQDKWRFHQRVQGRFPVPRTFLEPSSDLAFPCFVKPIRGKGSRGIALCPDRESLERRLAETSGLLIQDYLPGQEYSVDVLADLDGRPVAAVPRLRLTVNEGISVRGRVVHDAEIEKLCRNLAQELGVQGPVCMQLRRDASGAPCFMEVNPRMGGGTMFSVLAGVNLPACCLDLAMGRPLPKLTFSEITVVRYYEEIVLDKV